MLTQTANPLELGYFMDEADGGESRLMDYRALVRTVEDGMILPSRWETVTAENGAGGFLDAALGYTRYASFLEIPEQGADVWAEGGYGLGFSQAFLERQGVDPVTYLVLGEDVPWRDPAAWMHERLQTLHDDPDASFPFLEGQGHAALKTIRDDPQKQAILRAKIAEHANHARTYYEVVHPDELPKAFFEWRSTEPVHFSLRDVQTVYVSTVDEVSHFRLLYPDYEGTFVAFC